MLKEFRQFLLRGNVVDLAIAVVIGVAFGAMVNALVKDLLTPLISAVFGTHDFSSLTFNLGKSTFFYGDFINQVVTFVLIAGALFFLVVKPINAMMARRKTEPEVDSTVRECPECLSKIPVGARRCAFCTAEVAPATS
jgi:large conductance mechanosensitive channel